MPRIAYLIGQNENTKIRCLYQTNYRLTMMFLCPILVGLFCISDNFVSWFLGDGYSAVTLLIMISCPLIFFMCIGNFVGTQYLTPTRQQNKATRIYLLAAVANVILNLIMIPLYASTGAIIASLFAEMLSCCLQLILLKRSIYNFSLFQGIGKYIIISAIMGLVIYPINLLFSTPSIYCSLLQIIIGCFVYFLFLIIIKDSFILSFITTLRCSTTKQ